MRKKFLIFVLMFCLIIPCGFALSACCESEEYNESEEYKINVVQSTGGNIWATLEYDSMSTRVTSANEGDKVYLFYQGYAGYNFQYFVVDGNNISGNSFTMPNHNVTISASFIAQGAKVVNINYHTDAYTENSNPLKIEMGDYFTLRAPTKAGYSFVGWFDSEIGGNMYPLNTLTTFTSNAVDLYPRWQALFTVSGNVITGLTDYSRENLTDIVIPESIDGTTITTIATRAFEDETNIKNFTFNTNLTTFEEMAFHGTKIENVYFQGELEDWINLNIADMQATPMSLSSTTNIYFNGEKITNITFDESITEVKPFVFANFKVLENFYYDGSLDSYLRVQFANVASNPAYYATLCFDGLAPRGDIVITSNINYIQPAAFCGCENITSVTLPDSVKFIGEYAFLGCSRLAEINLEEVVYIYDGAFDSCSSLTSVNLEHAQRVYSYAFVSCSNLTSVSFGKDINIIGTNAFLACNLEAVDLSMASDMTSIGAGAFADNGRAPYKSIKTISLPLSIDIVEQAAFRNAGITEITIKNNIETFVDSALDDCTNLRNITIESDSVYSSFLTLPSRVLSLSTIKVKADIVDSLPENSFLHDSSSFTKTLDGDYYVFAVVK